MPHSPGPARSSPKRASFCDPNRRAQHRRVHRIIEIGDLLIAAVDGSQRNGETGGAMRPGTRRIGLCDLVGENGGTLGHRHIAQIASCSGPVFTIEGYGDLGFRECGDASLITRICSELTAERWEGVRREHPPGGVRDHIDPSIDRDIDDDDRSGMGFRLFDDGHKGKWPNVVSPGGSVFRRPKLHS